jgi:hypothetical protein
MSEITDFPRIASQYGLIYRLKFAKQTVHLSPTVLTVTEAFLRPEEHPLGKSLGVPGSRIMVLPIPEMPGGMTAIHTVAVGPDGSTAVIGVDAVLAADPAEAAVRILRLTLANEWIEVMARFLAGREPTRATFANMNLAVLAGVLREPAFWTEESGNAIQNGVRRRALGELLVQPDEMEAECGAEFGFSLEHLRRMVRDAPGDAQGYISRLVTGFSQKHHAMPVLVQERLMMMLLSTE